MKAYGFSAWRVNVDPKTHRKFLVQFYNLHKSPGKSWTVEHSSQHGIARASATQRFLSKNHQEGAAQKEPQDVTDQQLSFLLPEEDALSSPPKTKEGAGWSFPRRSTCVATHLDILARRAQALLARTPVQRWLRLLVGLSKRSFAFPTTSLFGELEIPCFAQAENPPSVAKLRFAEDFWGWLKGKVSQDGWEADSEQQLKNRIKNWLWGCRRVVEANRPALFIRLSSSCLTSLQSQSVNVSSKTRCSCGDQLKFTWIRFCRAPREDPKATAEHIYPFFLPQSFSKLPTSTNTIQKWMWVEKGANLFAPQPGNLARNFVNTSHCANGLFSKVVSLAGLHHIITTCTTLERQNISFNAGQIASSTQTVGLGQALGCL